MSLSSIPYFNFDIPVVSDLRGRFVYHYFTPGETIYPGDDDATLEDKTGAAFGFPRKIVLELKESLDDIADSGHTLKQWKAEDFQTAVLHYKPHTSAVTPDIWSVEHKKDDWIIYPWEQPEAETIQDYKLDK